jgi:hypothetical protein
MSAFLFIAMHAKRLLAIREFGSPAIYIRAGEVRVYVVWVRTRFLVDQCSVSFVSEVVLMRLEIVLVGPFDWGSTLIIGADVTHDLAVQIGDRSEDAAGDSVSLDF